LATYVDDLLATGKSDELEAFWEALGKAFTFKSEPSDVHGDEFLGIDFTRCESETHYGWDMGMSAYILDTIREYERLWETVVKPAHTPGVECVRTLNKAKSVPLAVERPLVALQSVVGRLLWVCRTARPDLAHMASAFGARVLTWDTTTDRELARTMGYLLLTHNAQLSFRWPKDRASLRPGKLYNTISTDADWVEPRSQSGMLASVSTGDCPDSTDGWLPVHWLSKKQSLSADSSTSAEIIAAHTGLREAFPIMLALCQFLAESGTIEEAPTVCLRVDNATCLKHVSQNPTQTFFVYAKACAVRISLLSDLHKAGIICASHVASALNPSDVFTKAFGPLDFLGKAKQTGLRFPEESPVHVANVAARGVLWRRRRWVLPFWEDYR